MALFAHERAGEGASTLVLLHGFGGSHHIWDDVCSSLDPACRILRYDLPGHGKSLDLGVEGAAPTFAKAILADIAARDLGPIHLVGHSLGGAVAILMALRASVGIERLTLLSPGGFGPEINVSLLRDYAAASSDAEIRSCLADMAGSEFSPPPHLVTRAVAERAAPGQLEALHRLHSLITRGGRQGAFSPEQLSSLAMPVDLVWGDRDPVLPFDQTRNAPASFRIHQQPGLGHMLPLEAPEAMARLISCAISC